MSLTPASGLTPAELVAAVLAKRCPLMNYEETYAFRQELVRQGLLRDKRLPYGQRHYSEHNKVPGYVLDLLSFRIDHGKQIEKCTFLVNQDHCRIEVLEVKK